MSELMKIMQTGTLQAYLDPMSAKFVQFPFCTSNRIQTVLNVQRRKKMEGRQVQYECLLLQVINFSESIALHVYKRSIANLVRKYFP